MQTTRKIKLNIFPVFYLFYGIYTKFFIIFESVHNFLHNFTYQAFLNKKKKKKAHCATQPARLVTAQAGPRALPRRTRALPLSHAATDGRVPPVRISFHLPSRLR